MTGPKRISPNTVLPKGGLLLPEPIKKKIGGWSELTFDAKVERLGLTLYRVKNGMGDGGYREDWIIDVPRGCISVHDYQWREPRWGLRNYKSFDEAIAGEIKEYIDYIQESIIELREDMAKAEQTLQLLEYALKT